MSNAQRFGAHMSIAGGLHNALARGLAVGCDCIQIFVRNQRQWSAPPLTDEQVRLWRRATRQTGIRPVIAHGSYLVNLASPEDALWERSIGACLDELQRCDALGVRDLVVHPGAHMGAGVAAGIRRIAAALDRLFEATAGGKARILLETTAGQGTSIGHTFEQLAAIIAAVRHPDRLGVCVDTQHALAAGYDLVTPDGYDRTVAALRGSVGLRRVRCLHINDSKVAMGSRVDRHEHIGQGKIGRAVLARLLNDPRLARVPRILETPKGTDGRGRDFDAVNLARLRRMVTG